MARPRLANPNFSLWQRKGIFYVRWWKDGTWQRRSLHTRDENEAVSRFTEIVPAAANPDQSILSWNARKRTSQRGGIAEAKAMVRLLELGAEIFVPWGHDHRADFVAVHGTRIRRVQFKSATTTRERTTIRGTSVRRNGVGYKTAVLHPDECDVIIGYCPVTDRCFATEVAADVRVYVFNPAHWLDSLDAVFGCGTGNSGDAGTGNVPVKKAANRTAVPMSGKKDK